MTLRHMRIFTAVCDGKSATAAAKKLGIAQPAVSLAVKELEEYYGIRLFDRISHKMYITEEGKRFLQYARKILALFDEMECGVKDREALGSLRVGSSITIGTCLLPDYMRRFRAAHPRLSVYVTVDNSAAIEKMVLENQLDFAMIEGSAHSDSLIRRRFRKDELVFVCGAGSALAGRDEIPLEALPELPFILREKGSGTRELFDSALLTRGMRIAPAWESISTEAIVRAVAAGLGVSVLPLRLVEPEIAARELIRIAIPELKLERYFTLIYHKDKHLSPSALDFFRMLREDSDCGPLGRTP